MEENYDDIILLERYLDQSLTEEQRRQVEKRLAGEPALQELLQNEKLLIGGIRFSHLKKKLGELKTLEGTLPSIEANQHKSTRVISMARYWKPMAIAAGLILAVVGYLLWSSPVNPSELYARNFKAYPNVFEPVVRGTTEQNQRAEAFAAYERGDYATAAKGFRKLINVKEEPGILMLLGNANLILGRTAEAKENFVTLSKDFDDLDLLAKWYLSLCYLKSGDTDSAKVLLEEIAGQGNSYQEKAKELLKQLH